ncbi:MAG: hypothetical protein ACXWQ5_00240 [Ktedonobacterales bacterium]
MGKYLTPQQYYLAEDSIPGLAAIPANIIARTILRAETVIDAYVGFDARLGGFEPHTSWYQEGFDDHTRRTRIPNFPVPIRTVNRYRIQFTQQMDGSGVFATVNPNDCAINSFGGYVEIVPIQTFTYSLVPYMFGLGLHPPLVQIDYTAGFYFASFGEVLENQENDGINYRAQRGFWAQTIANSSTLQPNVAYPTPTVYVNGVVQTTGFTIDYTEGVVTFTASQGSAKVTADYTYQIPDSVREATITQTTYLLNQRNLNRMGLGGIEVARSRDQQIKRHIRTSADASGRDEPALDSYAMQLLEQYISIPGA